MGGLANILSSWELEARKDQLPEQTIQAVISRLRDYHQLTPESRKVVLQGIWQRVQRDLGLESDSENRDAASTTGPEQTQTKPPQETEQEKPASPPAPAAAAEPVQVSPIEKTPEPTPPELEIEAPVTALHGIGPKRAEALERLGITKIRDLIYHYPRRHDDYSQLKPIQSLWFGEEVTIIGSIVNINTRSVRSGRMKIVEAVVSDKSGSLRVTWFNQPWIAQQLGKAKQVVLSGTIEQYLGRLTMNNPEWEPLTEKQLHTNRIVPVYPLTRDLTQKWLRGLIHDQVKVYTPFLDDPLPEDVIQQTKLLSHQDAVREIHFPSSDSALARARERLAFEEIFYLQVGVLKQKYQWENRTGRSYPVQDEWLEEQLSRLPYSLTGAQDKALKQIRGDLQSAHPMNRLLQGDVGSGKTVVAALAALIVIHHGAQAAVMAPTSILAEQHFQSFKDLLTGPESELRNDDIRLLIGSTPESEKEEIRQGLKSGAIKLVIGTHALLQDPVVFQNLQFAVVDEQHRFGVEQRSRLREKGENPHLLVMTATPIPRSLALTLYGDLELSVIDELPPGRQPVETHVLYPRETERAYSLIRRQVEIGNQAFIIYPLVEESDKMDEKAAVEEYQQLQKSVFPSLKLGLLHGRLSPEEKESVMTRFRDRELQVMVSTSVIEVGVDIPQATVMVIEGADRFGLAQLHQFRGRVGRGDQQSYCILIPGSAEAVENKRLLAMKETNDGFKLAEYDLKLRGPGQFLGTRQSGFSELKVASMSDLSLIEQARQEAISLFESDPELNKSPNQKLSAAVSRFWDQEFQGDIS